MAKTFSTLDLFLAAFLSLHERRPVLEVRNGKVIFSFDATDDLYRLMNRFNANEPVPVADFVTAAKMLRGRMLTLKEGIGENGKATEHGQGKTF